MARPEKQGLDYFPHDINSNSDPKLEYIETVYGLTGYAIYFKLLEKIYANSYWLKWIDRDEIFISKRYQMDVSVFKSLMEDFFNEGLFDRQLYKKHQILTSLSIQNRYFSAIERRKKIYINKNYLLSEPDIPEKIIIVYINGINDDINQINDNINPVSSELNGINDDIKTQSKVKESKVSKEIDVVNFKEKAVREKKPFIPPTLEEAKVFFRERGFKESVAERAWLGYDVADWHNSQKKKIANWKQTFIQVWFKDENKAQLQQHSYTQKSLEEQMS